MRIWEVIENRAQQGQRGSIHLVDRLGPRRYGHFDVRKQQVTENNGDSLAMSHT